MKRRNFCRRKAIKWLRKKRCINSSDIKIITMRVVAVMPTKHKELIKYHMSKVQNIAPLWSTKIFSIQLNKNFPKSQTKINKNFLVYNFQMAISNFCNNRADHSQRLITRKLHKSANCSWINLSCANIQRIQKQGIYYRVNRNSPRNLYTKMKKL